MYPNYHIKDDSETNEYDKDAYELFMNEVLKECILYCDGNKETCKFCKFDPVYIDEKDYPFISNMVDVLLHNGTFYKFLLSNVFN
jgi:hypothetical protein